MTAKLITPRTPAAIGRARELLLPAFAAALDRLTDQQMRRVAGYQLGLWDAEETPTPGGGGKVVRPALVLLASQAVCGSPQPGLAGAVAVELVHNFSLLHDDIMDRDVERRHRATGWVAFGQGQAILAGNAMLTTAIEIMLEQSPHADATVPMLLSTVQRLINGQAADLALEGNLDAELADVLDMAEGKTAALISGALAIGALSAGASTPVVTELVEAGRLLGLAFQLFDDVLGVVGDSAATGKSSSSDIRVGKRSAPVVAALRSRTSEGKQLAALLRNGPPASEDDIALTVGLIAAAGGLDWTVAEAERMLYRALDHLDRAALPHAHAVRDLQEMAAYLVRRDR